MGNRERDREGTGRRTEEGPEEGKEAAEEKVKGRKLTRREWEGTEGEEQEEREDYPLGILNPTLH